MKNIEYGKVKINNHNKMFIIEVSEVNKRIRLQVQKRHWNLAYVARNE